MRGARFGARRGRKVSRTRTCPHAGTAPTGVSGGCWRRRAGVAATARRESGGQQEDGGGPEGDADERDQRARDLTQENARAAHVLSGARQKKGARAALGDQ